MIDETTVIETWLFQTLSSNSTIQSLIGSRIYAYQAPQGAVFPYIVFGVQAGIPRFIQARRHSLEAVYRVIASGQNVPFSVLQPIHWAAELALHRKAGNVGGGTVTGCIKENTVKFLETTDGIEYRHFGALYRITASPT